MRFGRGYRPDPVGHHVTGFHLLAGRLGASAKESDLTGFAPPVMDQGGTGSCTGHGTSGALFTACAAAGKPLPFVPSPRGIYLNARALDRFNPSEPLTDDGAMPNQVMRSVSEWGVRAMGPSLDGRVSDCDPTNVNDEPTLGELEQEALHLNVGWYRIGSTGPKRITDIVAALSSGMPVGIGAFVDTSFENWTADKPALGAQDFTDPNGGGHWTFLLGHRTRNNGAVEICDQNSWSEEWGDGGRIWLAEDFIQQASDLYAFAPTMRKT